MIDKKSFITNFSYMMAYLDVNFYDVTNIISNRHCRPNCDCGKTTYQSGKDYMVSEVWSESPHNGNISNYESRNIELIDDDFESIYKALLGECMKTARDSVLRKLAMEDLTAFGIKILKGLSQK